jgi:hypothetical protein
MIKIESEKQIINKPIETIFNFLSNFNNFEKLMPEQIINWKSTEDTCSFTIKGMTDLSMKITKKLQFSEIVMAADGKAPFEYELISLLEIETQQKCRSQLVFKAELSTMMSMMVSKPLENFVNILNQKLKTMFD